METIKEYSGITLKTNLFINQGGVKAPHKNQNMATKKAIITKRMIQMLSLCEANMDMNKFYHVSLDVNKITLMTQYTSAFAFELTNNKFKAEYNETTGFTTFKRAFLNIVMT